MKQKLLMILGPIVVLLIALYFVTDFKSQQDTDDQKNPYGKDNLDQATIDQLDNPDYQNQIVPNELDEKLENGKDMFVYFYHPECPHCKKLTPRLVPLAQEMSVDMKKVNLLEFKNAWGAYGIESTPTLVYYEDGNEVNRVNGAQPNDMFRDFFNEYAVDDSDENDQAS
ncbi:hypothetical protein GCM10008983_13950 [Lentibacillus halophilus]|uniref:Thioredoxin domain-containing protein n=1 Tax=Lentibacillus halophilus TaxID=295065 RepID=A0ABN0Z8A9_9BACI